MSEKSSIIETQIPLTNKHYIKLGLLISIVLWLVGATVFFMNEIKVTPLQNEKFDLEQELEKTKAHNSELTSELSALGKENKALLVDSDVPILYEPSEGATIIGNQVRFMWNYPQHNRFQKYFLEIISLSKCNKGIKYNVLNPEKKRMHFPRNKLCSGKNLWRITPGYLSGDQEIIQGQASKYSMFTVYESVVDRIQKEKAIRVGTSPTFSGKFNFLENNEIKGFDIDLIKWIASKLEKKLKLNSELKVLINDVPWDNLLPMLEGKELDIVISSMTSTSVREKKFQGIKFSEGYFQIQQIFIQHEKKGYFPEDLKGKKVGVSNNTTSQDVAIYLSQKYDFDVASSDSDIGDLYQELEEKKVDFALVDDILVQSQLKNGRFHQFNADLDKDLKKFYKDTFGRDSEMYAIALFDETNNDINLLSLVNSLLKSKEGQKKLYQLKEKWLSES